VTYNVADFDNHWLIPLSFCASGCPALIFSNAF